MLVVSEADYYQSQQAYEVLRMVLLCIHAWGLC